MDAATAQEITRLRAEVAASNAAITRMRHILVEYAAKQAAQRMFLIGLASHAGQKMETFDTIIRGVEQATRDLRTSMRKQPSEAGQLIVDEMSRIAAEMRGRVR